MKTRRAAAALLAATMAASGCALEPVDLFAEERLALRSTIRAADGSFLARLYIENRALVSLDDIPQELVDAVLAAEDSRFFQHPGFDLRAIARAAAVNADRGETVQGGSTITQQYVKNAFFEDPPRTLERKAKELRLALELERRLSKREILERYLNTVYFGNGAYGARAAAEIYFSRRIQSLTLAEAALLAALIKAPAHYDPRDHPRAAVGRRNYVLDRMVSLDMITPERADRAKEAALRITPDPPRITTRQPYFVEAVKREVLRDPRLGATESERADALWKGGLVIESTLKPRLQRAAERAIDSVLGRRGDPEAALVAIDPRTGRIVAMVGGRDWRASQVNLALGRAGGGSGRQSGSAFKPVVAAAALEQGISLETRYESSPAAFTFEDGSTWAVGNAEGGGYGMLPLDEAMVHSVNGVYARLGLQIGPGQVATQAALMGVRTKLPALPSIALGSAEVSVLDIASVYATLANQGTAVEPTTIRSITFPDGAEIRPEQRRVERAVSPGNVWMLTKVLEQVIIRGTGRAAGIGRPAAGKTGTTNDYADAWFAGYTPDLVAAVWVGYPEGRIPMRSVHGITVFGGTFPAAIWKAFMIEALKNVPPHDFEFPQGELVRVEIDPASGLLAAPWCPGEKRRVLRDLVPTTYCPRPIPAFPAPVTAEPSASASNGPRDGREERQTPPPATREPSGGPSPEPTPEQSPRPTSTQTPS